jgi:hypothetical protein
MHHSHSFVLKKNDDNFLVCEDVAIQNISFITLLRDNNFNAINYVDNSNNYGSYFDDVFYLPQ